MPVNLGELRTLVAESVRVQRIQELQQGAGRASQEVLTAQFQAALDERRQSVSAVENIDRIRIDPDLDQGPPGNEHDQDGDTLAKDDTAANSDTEDSLHRPVGGIIDLLG